MAAERSERGVSGRRGGGRRRTGHEGVGGRGTDGMVGGPAGVSGREFSYMAGDVADDLLSFVGKTQGVLDPQQDA
ncbi:hypothetical protein PV330_19130 [Streptomyces caniscabiei]|uniref:hypothetical protein n=1 Tax=Streptomyces caniscabiei TaxID=2746961 RepID=UPI0029B1D528|nr:hypothetical protein [Streptomyces caniscabiei]MDX2602112.1 hypothetical protein [Streptomyces caniscabiei]MDX2737548.1 hypothetical protein [Streptomyces caniscabiei]